MLSQIMLSDSPEEKEAKIRQIRAALLAVRYANIISKELPLETKMMIRSKIVDVQLFGGPSGRCRLELVFQIFENRKA